MTIIKNDDTADSFALIEGTFDFLGLNHYSSYYCSSEVDELQPNPSIRRDSAVTFIRDPSWTTAYSPWLYIVPWGMRVLLNYIRTTYNNPPVFILENGYSTSSNISLEDLDRIKYHHDYIEQMLLAMREDDCNVIGYGAWSLLDNFEWSQGFSEKFGLIHVDFDDPERPRTKKQSAEYFKLIMEERMLPSIEDFTNRHYAKNVPSINK